MYKKHTLPSCAGIALALLLLANPSARADLISWGYNWTPSAAKISADGGSSGYLSLTNTLPNTASGSSNTVITNLRTFSNAASSGPDTFTHANVSYTLQLTDTASHTSGNLTFAGHFSGSMTGSSANVQLHFTSPMTQSLALGGNTYSVSIGSYTPPGPPGASNVGSLNAFVSVTPGNGGGGTISSVPEPSALLLAGLALPWVSLSGWRARRKRR